MYIRFTSHALSSCVSLPSCDCEKRENRNIFQVSSYLVTSIANSYISAINMVRVWSIAKEFYCSIVSLTMYIPQDGNTPAYKTLFCFSKTIQSYFVVIFCCC